MAPKNRPARPGKEEPQGEASLTERTSRRPESNSRTRRDQRKAEYDKQQRQWFWTKIGLIAIALVFVVFGAFRAWDWYERWQVTRDVDSYFGATDFVATHEDDEPILYEQIPPVGGYHTNAWQNCGFYGDFIHNENGVHSLEHGAVWITFDPELPQEDIDVLRAKAEEQFVLVSPYPGMDAPVVASVWGKQIKLDGVNDDRLDPFIAQYKKNVNNSPEPFGICWSGVGATTDQVPQQDPFIRAEGTDPVGGIPASFATATAAALNPEASTPATAGTPAASADSVIATPQASPGASPMATIPAATPDEHGEDHD